LDAVGFDVIAAFSIVVFLAVDLFAISYGWLRGLLGEIEPDLIPAARANPASCHRGFRQEPRWLRPLQAAMLATGLTVAVLCAVIFVLVAVSSAFV
jgi:hypothetical protein